MTSDDRKNVENIVIPNLYEFARDYILIKDGNDFIKSDERELNMLLEYSKMVDDGYKLELIHNRRGDFFAWYKSN